MTNDDQPAQAYLALACVIVNFKPHGISAEDYLLSLRNALRTEPHQRALRNPVINSAVLWHELFAFSQFERLNARPQDLSENCLEANADFLPQGSLCDRKRKAQASTQNNDDTRAKRQKIHALEDLDNGSMSTPVSFKQHRDRSLLLKTVFELSRLNGIASCNEKPLSVLVQAANTMKTIWEKACDTSFARLENVTRPITLHESSVVIKKTWLLLIDKILLFSMTAPSLHSAMASVVQAMLERLHQYCLDEVDAQRRFCTLRRKKAKHKFKKAQALRDEQALLASKNCELVSSTLAAILAHTAKLRNKHPQCFQSVSAAFLEHLGSALSLSLFGDAHCTSTGEGLLVPRGSVNVSHLDPKESMKTVQLEAPYLIHVLEVLVSSLVTSSGKSRSKGSRSASIHDNAELASRQIVKKLQSSLLRGMFHEFNCEPNTNNKVDHAPIQMQQPRVETPEVLQDNITYKWFPERVWQLLGWDILMEDDLKQTAEE